MQLVVGAEHPLAGRRVIDKSELAGLRFVAMHRSSTVQGIKSALEAAGIQWKTLQVVMVRVSWLAPAPALNLAQESVRSKAPFLTVFYTSSLCSWSSITCYAWLRGGIDS